MRYQHICQYVADTPWAILPGKLRTILALLTTRASGEVATAEDLVAFAGSPAPGLARNGAIAVLPLRGVIAHRAGMLEESSGGTSTEAFGKMYRQVMADPGVSAVVLDVDSPGGAVAGLHELATDMLALRGVKPVVAVANGTMASAAYWLSAAAADEIVAIPSATVGSVGVASIYVDDSKSREQDGISVDVFTSGAHKADVLGLGPLSPEARVRIQARVDEAGQWFRGDVAKGRGVSVADVRGRFGEGLTFGAKDAKAAGLIDRIATLEETVTRLSGRSESARLRADTAAPKVDAAPRPDTNPPGPLPTTDKEIRARRLRLR